jgi:hypothetical protein
MVDYKQKLESELSRKRVFLVLDDVWKDEDFDALDVAKGEGSVTTRIESILQRPCISKEHMKTLSPEDSWSLFCVHAFGTSSSVPHRLEASAKSMAEECGGLPLALKVIGAAMFGKTSDEHEWKPLLKKLNESRMQERTMKMELYEHLKLGYDVLKEDDPRLEDCSTYFAAFPEDHEVEFQVLLWCWIGEGLVPADVGDDPEFDAYDLLMKLRRRSLIESVEKSNADSDSGGLGIWPSNCFPEESDGELDEVSAEELHGQSDENLDEELDEDTDEIQDEELDEEIHEKLDEELDEEMHEEMHEELDEEWDEKSDEKMDEYLDEEFDEKVFPQYKVPDVKRDSESDVKWTDIDWYRLVIPPPKPPFYVRKWYVGMDGELKEELDEELKEESDEELDEKLDEEVFPQYYKVHDVMRDLAFYILQIDGRTTPSQQLALYQAGQNLTEFPPKWITECKQPLKAHRLSLHQNKLKTLPSTFCAPQLLTLLPGYNEISDVPAGFLKGIQNLRVLDLCHGRFQYLPEELGNLRHLVYLNLSNNSRLQELPESIENLRMLRHLTLSHCSRLRYLPSGVVGLKSLQVLDTESCIFLTWCVRTVSLENISGFKVLTHLCIEGANCEHVLLPDNISALTKLEDLRLYRFPNLKTFPAWMPDFKKLRSLTVAWCSRLERLPDSFTCGGAFPALIELKLMNCHNLVEFPEVEGAAVPKLQTLVLTGSHSLGSLPLSLEVLTNLRNLHLRKCTEDLRLSCIKNRKNSLIWRSFRIKFSILWFCGENSHLELFRFVDQKYKTTLLD